MTADPILTPGACHCSDSILDVADRALASGQGIVLDQQRLGICTDLEVLEDISNDNCSCGLKDAWRLVRPDGRVVLLFRRDEAAA